LTCCIKYEFNVDTPACKQGAKTAAPLSRQTKMVVGKSEMPPSVFWGRFFLCLFYLLTFGKRKIKFPRSLQTKKMEEKNNNLFVYDDEDCFENCTNNCANKITYSS
jgi:hypothetical protein